MCVCCGGLRLFAKIFSGLTANNKDYKIVIIGLNNAGKTTCLYKLCGLPHAASPLSHSKHADRTRVVRSLGEVIQTQATVGSNLEEVQHKNIKFQVRVPLLRERRRHAR